MASGTSVWRGHSPWCWGPHLLVSPRRATPFAAHSCEAAGAGDRPAGVRAERPGVVGAVARESSSHAARRFRVLLVPLGNKPTRLAAAQALVCSTLQITQLYSGASRQGGASSSTRATWGQVSTPASPGRQSRGALSHFRTARHCHGRGDRQPPCCQAWAPGGTAQHPERRRAGAVCLLRCFAQEARS